MAGTRRRASGSRAKRKAATAKAKSRRVVDPAPATAAPIAEEERAREESLFDACASGDHRRALEAMRNNLAGSMAFADPNVVAQIAGRLQAVLKELASLPKEKVSASDDLARRREERRAEAARRASTGGAER